MKGIACFFFFSIICLTVPAQTIEDSKKEKLISDLLSFKSVLLSAHPNLYRFYSKTEFDSAFNEVESKIEGNTSDLDFFRYLSSIASMVGEAHTGLDISKDLANQIKENGKLLPFNIHFQNGKAYIKEELADKNLHMRGKEIISINGKSIEQIVNQINTVSSIGTGFNLSRVYRMLSYSRNFSLSYYLYVDTSSSFLVEYQDNGVEKTDVFEGIKPRFEVKTLLYPKESIPPFSFSIDRERDVAVLKITTFAHFIVDYSKKQYQRFFDSAFKQIEKEKISNLIIDVRNNRGGQELLGGYLLSYLNSEPFSIQKSIYAKEINNTFNDSLKVIHHPFDTKHFIPGDTGYVLKKHMVLNPFQPKKRNAFKGKIYFIINGNCFSACNIFAALADHYNLGIMVGEETGGNYQDTDGYYGVSLELPNSKHILDFRKWHLKTNVISPNHGRGVQPDKPFQPSVMDAIQGNDSTLDYVYTLIEESKD